MRVLVNALSARRGGILTYTRNLLAAFKDRGIEITVAAPTDLDLANKKDIDVIDITRLSPVNRFIWEQISWRQIVKKYNPDILFSSANFGLLFCPVKQVLLMREGGLFDPYYLANMTASQGIGSMLNRYFRRDLMLRSAKSADHIITPTKAMRDMVSLWSPTIFKKCSVNPYGTINESFKPEPPRRNWREGGELKILYVSVYYPHKAPSVVCRVVDHLNELGIRSKATITMSPQELTNIKGGYMDEFIIKDADVRGAVTLGHFSYDDLPQLYRSHDVFLFPSVSETFGHPMAEAMSSGLPVIVSDTAVNREICGETALYFRPFNSRQVVQHILELDRDNTLLQKLKVKGRQRAKNLYSWNDHVDRLVQTFQKVIAED